MTNTHSTHGKTHQPTKKKEKEKNNKNLCVIDDLATLIILSSIPRDALGLFTSPIYPPELPNPRFQLREFRNCILLYDVQVPLSPFSEARTGIGRR